MIPVVKTWQLPNQCTVPRPASVGSVCTEVLDSFVYDIVRYIAGNKDQIQISDVSY